MQNQKNKLTCYFIPLPKLSLGRPNGLGLFVYKLFTEKRLGKNWMQSGLSRRTMLNQILEYLNVQFA